MAEAILSRLLSVSLYQPVQVMVSEPVLDRRNFLRDRYQIQVTADNTTLISSSRVVLLAIKPQILPQLAAEFGTHSGAPPELVLSILAGINLEQLAEVFPHSSLIRAMPNTPATVGAGMTAIASSASVSPTHKRQAAAIFQAIGEVVEVPESLMDAVTGLSGSGPGFIAIAIEALTDGGVAAGLPRAIAAKLALATVWGTAELLRQSGLHPAQLKDQVTSPGGTTIAGIAALEQSGFRSALIRAVQAASDRSKQLGQG
uniref:Pyrroline-5-carboxylate reductase n=1 Tax=Cyanothece sp. (strain PCC 7425 / ATCC 29141) TaxID=395961 RepID=B8HPI1_CYAP4